MATVGSDSAAELKAMRTNVANLVHWLHEAWNKELVSEDGDLEWAQTAQEHDRDGYYLLRAFNGEDGDDPASKFSSVRRFWDKGGTDVTQGRMQTFLNEYETSRIPGSYPPQAPSALQGPDATLQLCYEAWCASVKKKTMPYALTAGHISKETLTKWGLSSMVPE